MYIVTTYTHNTLCGKHNIRYDVCCVCYMSCCVDVYCCVVMYIVMCDSIKYDYYIAMVNNIYEIVCSNNI